MYQKKTILSGYRNYDITGNKKTVQFVLLTLVYNMDTSILETPAGR